MFLRNVARTSAGAVYIRTAEEATVSNCTFERNNSSNSGGAMYMLKNSNTYVRNCSFIRSTGMFV